MKRLGFIGMGNMARAIASGLASAGALRGEDMAACALRYDRLKEFADGLGMQACATARELVEGSEVVLMAVKPYVVPQILDECGDLLAGRALLSIAAGWDLARYREALPKEARVQYIMPNTPCQVGAGVLLFEAENTLHPEELQEARRWFSALGTVETLPSRLMNAGMGVSGCGPAFIAMVIEALGDAGVRYGLPRETAYRIASQTVAGTGLMQLKTSQHPAAMKDAVCSPGGTTIRGVEALEACGLRHALLEAVGATLRP